MAFLSELALGDVGDDVDAINRATPGPFTCPCIAFTHVPCSTVYWHISLTNTHPCHHATAAALLNHNLA
jgi:hypothetical protein